MPPSSRHPPDAKIAVSTLADLTSHFAQLQHDLSIPETEDTWQKLEKALVRLQAITKGGATKFPEYIPYLKQLSQPINNSLLSERTRLSGTAGDLINSVAPRLVERFDALVQIFVPTLLLICARTNKVAVKRAEKSLLLICKHCKLPSLLPLLREAAKDKGQGLRAVAMGCILALLEATERAKLSRKIADIETSIKGGATDSNPEVRQITKKVFELYIAMWPERVESFIKPLTPTIRRYLALPKTGALVVDVPIQAATAAAAAPPPPSSRPASASSSSRPTQRMAATTPTPSTVEHSATPTDRHREHGALESAAFPVSSSLKRTLFTEQLAAVRSQQQLRASRGTPQMQEDTSSAASSSSSSSMRAPPAMLAEGGRHERTREFELPLLASRRAKRWIEEPEPAPPTLNPNLRVSVSSRSAALSNPLHPPPHPSSTLSASVSSMPTTAAAPAGSHHPNPFSASLGPSTTPASRHLASSTSSAPISSFAAASGLHGRSQILAAYSHAFSREHLRASSHPDLGSLASASAAVGVSPNQTEVQSSGDGRPWMDKPVPTRSQSDDAPSCDPVGGGGWLLHQQQQDVFSPSPPTASSLSSKANAAEASRGAAPSDGVADRLVQAQQRHLLKMHDVAISNTASDEREGRYEASSSSSSSNGPTTTAATSSSEAGRCSQSAARQGQSIKASRVPATRPALPSKTSAVRVSVKPGATPSATGRTTASALRASAAASSSSSSSFSSSVAVAAAASSTSTASAPSASLRTGQASSTAAAASSKADKPSKADASSKVATTTTTTSAKEPDAAGKSSAPVSAPRKPAAAVTSGSTKATTSTSKPLEPIQATATANQAIKSATATAKATATTGARAGVVVVKTTSAPTKKLQPKPLVVTAAGGRCKTSADASAGGAVAKGT